jgi:carboxypeptidase T
MLKLLVTLILCSTATAFSQTSTQSTLEKLAKTSAGDVQVSTPTMSATKPAASAPARYWAVVAASTREERTKLSALGLTIDENTDKSVSGVASEKTLSKIKTAGFTISYSTTLERYHRKFVKDFPSSDSKYHNYTRTYSELQSDAKALDGYASLYSIGKSVENRDIWCLRLNKDAKNDDASSKPGALFVGDHHSREHLSVEVPLAFAKWLADNKDTSDVKAMLDARDIYIIPMLNPDGAEYDIATGQYQYWRKNTRKLDDGNMGTDLNRNYDNLWGVAGASSDSSDETYMGPSAFSEPETQAMRDFLGKHTNITDLIAYHTYGKNVYYPWSGQDADITDQTDLAAFKTMSAQVAQYTGYNWSKSSALYLSSGDFCDWAYAEHHIFALTIELEPGQGDSGGFYPGAEAINQASPGNIQAMFYMVKAADNPRSLAQQN